MAAPAYIGNGGIGASDNSATVAVPFPTLQADDILILQLLSAENDTHQQPTGFAALGTQVNESTNQTSSWWWKRAVGTESGNLTCSRTNSGDAFFGLMSCWRGARLTGTPFNSAGPASGNSNAYSSSAITPTYNNSTVIVFVNEENNVALGKATDYTTEPYDLADTTGDDVEFNCSYIQQTTAALVAAKTGTITNAQSWATITLALWSPIPLTINATKATATGTGYNPTIDIPSEPLTINCTLATATGTDYAATVQADVDTTVEVGGGGTGKNIFQNPSFESGIDGWTVVLSATLSQSTTQAWHGSNSLRVASGSNWSGAQSPPTTTTESTEYTVSFYIWPVDGSMPFYMDLRDQDENFFADLTIGTKTAGQWTRVTKTFTTSAGDTAVLVRVRKDDYAGTDYFYLDGFQLELGAAATDWEDYGASGGPDEITTAALDATINVGTGIGATKGAAMGTGYNPTIQTNEPTIVNCIKGAATATTYAATVEADVDVNVTATKGIATVTGYASTVEADVDVSVSASCGSITVTGYAAAVEADVDITINATAGATTGASYAATVSASNIVNCSTGAAVATGYDATIDVEAATIVTSTKGTATGASHAAVVQADVDTTVNGTTGVATGTSLAAVVNVGTKISAANDSAAVTAHNATVQADTDTTASCTKGEATVTGYDTTILGIPTVISATKATATATGYDAGVGGLVYYVRSDGTAANKAAATSDANASTSMSIATHNSQTFSPGDTIIISDAGGEYRGTRLNIPSSGSAGSPITYLASGTPALKGSKDISTASYSWTASGSGTNEYYLRTSGGTDPALYEPDDVYLDDVVCEAGTIGALADHEWGWGDNDTLGYSTVYIRDNSGDPDTSSVLIEAAQIGTALLQNLSYVTIDGLIFKHASQADGEYVGALRMETVSTTNHIIIKNCTITWCGGGITLKGDYNELDNCTASYVRGHSLSIGGEATNHADYNTIKNCVVHHARLDEGNNDYGLKLLYADHSEVYGNEVYNCGLGIDLDGDMDDETHGCQYNNVYDNWFHDNNMVAIHLEWWSLYNKVYRNLCWNNGRTGTGVDNDEIRESFAGDIGTNSNNEYFYNVCGKTSGGSGDATPDSMMDVAWGAKVYGNVFYGGGVCIRGIVMDGGANANPQNCKIKNNIFDGFTAPCLSYNSSHENGFDGLEIDYNCYRRSDASANVVERDWGSMTIATHYSSYGQDQHSLNADPKFKDAANGKFYLVSDSPCINVGVDLGATYDDGIDPHISPAGWPDAIVTLDQDSWGTGWEIGAYVYDYADVATATATAYAATVLTGSQTIIATNGVATAAGKNATVLAFEDVTVNATLGTAVATGYDIGLAADLVIPCTSDAVTGAGYDASISLESGIVVACGSITATAFAATVEADIDTTVTASSGTATATNYAAIVQDDVDVAIAATAGTVAAAGYATVISVGTGIAATKGIALGTSYDVALAADNNITATKGTATATGNAAGVSVGAFIAADVAAATATGYNPTVLAAMAISATAGTATATGYDATVGAELAIPITLGAVTVAGYAAGVGAKTAIAATVANAVATALNASISGITSIGTTKASATLTGYDPVVSADVTMTATLGTAALTALNALLSTDVTTVATKGTITVTGCNPAILLPIDITATKAEATAAAHAATVNVGTNISIDVAAATATAHNPVVYWPLGIEQTSTPAITVTGLDSTIFEGIINITCGAITVTAHTPTVTIPFRFLISPTITSSSISYTTTSSSIDYSIEEIA